jgi:hypothetical protein
MKHGGMMGDGMMEANCPMKVPGTSKRAVDVDGGVALEFSTTGDVAEVRRRVARMAEMHNHGGPGGGMMNGMMGGGMADGGTMQGHGMMGGGMADGGTMQGHGMMGGGMADGGTMQGHGMMGGGMADGGTMPGHGMMGGGMADGGMMGGGMMGGGMMDAQARAEDTPQGARLIFTPKDPKDLDALRAHAKEHADRDCPMMSMH